MHMAPLTTARMLAATRSGSKSTGIYWRHVLGAGVAGLALAKVRH